ncbi:MAG: hypothetical protein WC617_19780 [Rhodanobacter sp.]|jgi:hypothetical protein
MKTRLIAIMVGVALACSASAQRAMPMEGAASMAPPGALSDGVPPLPPGCRSNPPPPPLQRTLPDLSNNAAWRSALGISDTQAAQVQQLLKQQTNKHEALQKQQQAEDESTCAKLRSIVGDKAMSRWSQAGMPPPRPPMPPEPPEPPQPPMPPDAGQ